MNILSKSWPLFKAFGVPVGIHISFLGILAFVVLTNPSFVPIFLILMASILVHEFGHVLAGRRFGNDCSGVYLHLLGGVAMMRPSKSLKEDWMVAIAGPFTSLGLAGLFAAISLLLPDFWNIPRYGGGIFAVASVANLLIAIFNLAPVYPMDGGRIFKAIMEYFFGNRLGTSIALYTAKVISIVVGIWAVLSGFWTLALIAAAVIIMGNAEQAATRGRR